MLPNGLSGKLDVRLRLQCPPPLVGASYSQCLLLAGATSFTNPSVCQASAELLEAVIGLPEMPKSSLLPALSSQLWLHNAFVVLTAPAKPTTLCP